MKQLLLLLSLFFLGSLAFPQNYRPFIEEGKYWDVFYEDRSHPCFFDDFVRYSLGPDTLIDGKEYRNLIYFDALEFPQSICKLSFVVFDTVPNPTKFYFREDTQERKVFLLVKHSFGNNEELHYDFSLQVGDTISQEKIYAISYETLLNGTTAKTYSVGDSSYSQTWLIEGVGSLAGPLRKDAAPGNLSLLTCHGKKITGPLWGATSPFGGGNCTSHFVSIQPEKKEFFHFYPNPTQGSIRFEGEAIPSSFDLLDIQGKSVFKASVSSNGHTNLGKKKSGLYIIRLFDEKGNLMAYEKLMIKSQ